MRRVVLVLLVGVGLAAIAELRFGAGHPAVIRAIGAGDAVFSSSPSTDVPPGRTDRFRISGTVSGLYPGASLPLVLTISNPEPFTIVVTSITTSVSSPSAGCSSTHLTVGPFSGNLSVPATSTAKLTLTATLDQSTPDACQGVVFQLQYSGTAVKP